jgi:polyhydroxybutyrate depolymerase
VTRFSLGPGDHLREVPSVGTRRDYLLHVPNSYDAVTPFPVLVVLHGGGGSAAFASQVYGWPELSEREGCLAVFPEATPEDPTRPAAVRENPRIWNDGSTRSAVARRNVDDVGYLAAVLDDLQANFAIDAQRIFVTGFSNGASMTFRVGIELADRVAAIAPVSGHLCLQDPQPARPVSMLYIIGLADPLNPMNGGPVRSPWGATRQKPPVMTSILTWVRLIGASERHEVLHQDNGVTRVRYGPGKSGCEVQLCTVAGQGHEWPGARRTLPRIISGPQTDKLNATQAVWDFFAGTSPAVAT